MKKVINIVKNNKLVLLAFIIGLIISSVGVYYGATLFSSDQVIYSGTKSLKASLDELNSKTGVFDYATAQANTRGTILASKKGICISRNKKVYCFKVNNTDYNIDYMQQVFSDVTCSVYDGTSLGVYCNTSNFECDDGPKGLSCWDFYDGRKYSACVLHGNYASSSVDLSCYDGISY